MLPALLLIFQLGFSLLPSCELVKPWEMDACCCCHAAHLMRVLVRLTPAYPQNALAAAAAAAAALSPDQDAPQQQHPAASSRLALLDDIFDSNIPSTLTRPHHSTGAAAHRLLGSLPETKLPAQALGMLP